MIVAIHSLAHAAQEAALIAGIITASGIILGGVWAAIKLLKTVFEVVDGFEDIYEQRSMILRVVKELTPNEGTSVKDTVDRIDKNVATNARNIERVYTTVLKMHNIDPNDSNEGLLLEVLEYPNAPE